MLDETGTVTPDIYRASNVGFSSTCVFFGCDSVNNGIMDNQWKHIETMMVQKNTQRPQAKLHSLTFRFLLLDMFIPWKGSQMLDSSLMMWLWIQEGFSLKRIFRMTNDLETSQQFLENSKNQHGQKKLPAKNEKQHQKDTPMTFPFNFLHYKTFPIFPNHIPKVPIIPNSFISFQTSPNHYKKKS